MSSSVLPSRVISESGLQFAPWVWRNKPAWSASTCHLNPGSPRPWAHHLWTGHPPPHAANHLYQLAASPLRRPIPHQDGLPAQQHPSNPHHHPNGLHEPPKEPKNGFIPTCVLLECSEKNGCVDKYAWAVLVKPKQIGFPLAGLLRAFAVPICSTEFQEGVGAVRFYKLAWP